MWNIDIVPKAYAACDPGSASLNLSDCFILNDKGQTVESIYNSPTVLINLITTNLFILSGIILFFMIMYAGYQVIMGGTKGAEQAKNTVTTAFTGLVIMFAAFWILQIIKLLTGADIFL